MYNNKLNLTSERSQVEGITRHMVQDNQPTILSDIYQPEINIAIWQRENPATLQYSVKEFLVLNPTFKKEMILTPQDALLRIR